MDTMTAPRRGRRGEGLPPLQQAMAERILDGTISYRPEDGEYLTGGTPIGSTEGRALRAMRSAGMFEDGDGSGFIYRVRLEPETRRKVRAARARGDSQ